MIVMLIALLLNLYLGWRDRSKATPREA